MGRKKNNQQQKDGKHRRESKEERKARLKAQEEAREFCQQILPYVGVLILFFLIIFGFYVRSVPPKKLITPKSNQTRPTKGPSPSSVPEFMRVDTSKSSSNNHINIKKKKEQASNEDLKEAHPEEEEDVMEL